MITEIVNFEIDHSISDSDFINYVNKLEKNFHQKQSGYVDCELVKGNEHHWIIIMHWESKQLAHEASKILMIDENAKDFRNSIIPTSVKMKYLEQVKTWTL